MLLNLKEFRMLQTEQQTVLSGITVLDNHAEIPEKLILEITETLRQDLSVITVLKSANGFTLADTEVEIVYKGGHTYHKIVIVSNYAQNFTVRNCKFTLRSETQVNVVGLYNCGKLNTMLDSGADMLLVADCRFDIRVIPNEFPFENRICAIENELANSVSVHGNYIFAQINGMCAGQKTFGVINTGRYMRCENNNIKANGCHNQGELLEAAYACGFYNSGQYLIFIGNNCVGEWGGKCIGFENTSQYCTVTGNKILATHTMCGRTVIISGNRNILANNILTGTSRNPRGIELHGDYNIITGNILETLQPADVLKSGCGIWAEGEIGVPVTHCTISDNTIIQARDFGIYLDNTQKMSVRGNEFIKHDETNDFVAVIQQNSTNNHIETVCEEDLQTEYDLYGRIERNQESSIRSLK